MREQIVVDYVKQVIAALGGYVVNHHGGRFNTGSGTPDLLCCLESQFIAIECKSPTGRLTASQLLAAWEITQTGGRVLFAYPDFLPEHIQVPYSAPLWIGDATHQLPTKYAHHTYEYVHPTTQRRT